MAPNNTLNVWGNERTMNLNSMILTNIQSSPYFKVNLYELKTYHEVIDEIYYKVTHMEPWEKGSRKTAGQTGMCGGVRGVGAGGIVSSAFCLLYKLFTLKLTRKQLCGLLEHSDSPYIRGLGFMYIRYTQDPKELWDWYEDYLEDEEEIDVKAGGGHVMTIGEMLRQWLSKLEWYSTLFPRIPVPVQKDIEQKLRAFNQSRAPPEPVEPPRHIADDEVNFGEAEKYASNAASRKRSPTPPYRSQRRTPPRRSPPRHRSPRRSPPPPRRSPPPQRRSPVPQRRSPAPQRRSPPPRRSPPRHRHSPPRYRRSRSPKRPGSPRRSPKKGASPFDYARELERERQRQNREKDKVHRRSSSRERRRSRERRISPVREKSSKHRSRSRERPSKHRSRSPHEKKSKHRSRSRSREKKKHKHKHSSHSKDKHNGRS